jgi:hypothetical protein
MVMGASAFVGLFPGGVINDKIGACRSLPQPSFPRPMRAIATRIFHGLVLSLIEVYILRSTGWKDEEQCSARPYRYNEAQR